MTYLQPVFRPPAEANSVIVQLTEGCNYNKCLFCPMYKSKTFRQRSRSELKSHLEYLTGIYSGRSKRVFIGDGDPLAVKTDYLLEVFKLIGDYFPEAIKFGIYGSVFSLRHKSTEELKKLRKNGLKYIYLGIESGDENLLTIMKKQMEQEEIIDTCKRVLEAKIALSVTIILGLGGIELSQKHIRASADIINKIGPTHVSLLKFLLEHTPFQNDSNYLNFGQGYYQQEIITFIKNISVRTIFRADHASNYLPIKGVLPRDNEKLVAILEELL